MNGEKERGEIRRGRIKSDSQGYIVRVVAWGRVVH